ncbi:hypothetical protein SAMN05444277_103323 [Parafilimonas terrae]|uniref:Uncharacterized protein n=1 Tax=Parafilimonas terrae TaxID=1465490 RepID=A0A1I5UIS0_9BACT|nr:hypothetical protein SAMN05444277_103323 [Parafilimonas terrae]
METRLSRAGRSYYDNKCLSGIFLRTGCSGIYMNKFKLSFQRIDIPDNNNANNLNDCYSIRVFDNTIITTIKKTFREYCLL